MFLGAMFETSGVISKKSLRVSLLLGISALATTLTIFMPVADNQTFQATFFILVVLSLISFFFLRNREGPLWASVSFLFTLSYLIVNLNIPALRIFGIDVVPQAHEFIWSSRDIFNQSVAISSLGLIYFLLGVAIASPQAISCRIGDTCMYTEGYIPAVAIVSLLLFLATSGSYAFGDYSSKGATGFASYFYKIFKVSLIALIVVKVTNYYTVGDSVSGIRQYLAHLGWPLLSVLALFLSITFVVGDRGPLILFSLMTFTPFLVRSARIGFLRIVLAGYLLAYLFSILGAARQARFEGGGFWERISATLSDSSFLYYHSYRFAEPVLFGHTLELAASVRVLNHIIANVPTLYDFGFGRFIVQQVASIVPGLGGLINKLFFGADWRMDGSSNFATFLVQGAFPTYGDGTSVTGELYLDFGVFGVALGLLLFGFVIGRGEHKLICGPQKMSFLWIFTLVYYANSLYLARSSLVLELSNVVLVFLLIKIAAKPMKLG